jgi:formylglycine-generating enzyme required for sulfatase activity
MKCPNCQKEIPEKSRFCPECGFKLPQKTAGVNIGDVGLIQNLHIGTEKEHPAPGGDYCPICGEWVKLEESFRCRQCGRTNLHREHRDRELNMCSECAEKASPTPPAPKAPVKVPSNGNEIVITLATEVEMSFVRVPAGVFLMGSKEDDADADEYELPQHKVHLDEYYIGKASVTNTQYAKFMEAVGYRTPLGWHNGEIYMEEKNHPVINVSWKDAQNFCRWASKVIGEIIRLPTEAEWEKAARGTDGRKYPWGNQIPDVGLCNYGHDVDNTTRIGRYSPQGDSPYGCMDMSGNVWEWTSTLLGSNPNKPWYKYPYRDDAREDPSIEGFRIARGGAFDSSEQGIRCAFRRWADPDVFLTFGFRCALLL